MCCFNSNWLPTTAWLCLLWRADARCASPRVCFFSLSVALKQTRANAAAETRAAPSRSSLLCFSSGDVFHIWAMRCCVHTAAVVVCELLNGFWVFVSAEPTQWRYRYFSKHPLLTISCSEPPIKECHWNFTLVRCNAVYSAWTALMVFRLLRVGEASVSSSPGRWSYLLSAERTDAFVTHCRLI